MGSSSYQIETLIIHSTMGSFSTAFDGTSPSVGPIAPIPPFPKWCKYLIQSMLGTMTALNFIGYGIIVFGSIKFKSELTPSQMITLSLGLSQIALDVIMLVCLPYVLNVCSLETRAEIICRMLFLVGFGSNVFLHTVIHSLDLCVKIRKPFTYIRKMTEKRALIIVVFSWMTCPCIGGAMVPFIHFDTDITKTRCLINDMELLYKIPFLFLVNSMIIILLLLVLVSAILVVSTARKQARKVRQQEDMLHGVRKRNGTLTARDDDIRRLNRLIAQWKRLLKSRPTSGKAIRDFLFFVSSFIVAWIALLVGADIIVLSHDENIHKINAFTGLVMLVYNQCAISILIYTLRQPDFKKTRQLLKKSICTSLTRLRNVFKE